jgi:hypothetical protein
VCASPTPTAAMAVGRPLRMRSPTPSAPLREYAAHQQAKGITLSPRRKVQLDSGLLEAVDEEAERRGLTRSSFLIGAAMEKITRVAQSPPPAVPRARSAPRRSR